MKILHTSDWHIGKSLGRYDRRAEFAEVLDEVLGIAEATEVDLVVVSGDIWDRPNPPTDALGTGIEALVRLAEGGKRPVVAIAGNHDSPDLLDVLAPLVLPFGVHLVGGLRRPAEGVLLLDTAHGRAAVGCVPFLREGRVVDFMAASGQWYGTYKERLARIFAEYGRVLDAHAFEAVTVLVAHAAVNGAYVRGQADGRGERDLHMGETYTILPADIPPGAQYIAMGHIHAPQRVPGAPGPAEYAGSLLPLDFGERDEVKRVVLVEAEPGAPARVESIALTTPWQHRLIKERGTWEALIERREEFAGAYLDLTVETAGPDPALAARATDIFERMVRVRADYPRERPRRPGRGGRAWGELYGEFHEGEHGEPPAEPVRLAFDAVLDAVVDTTVEPGSDAASTPASDSVRERVADATA